ncbi:class I SAM-dependent methyltransferase [Actinoplanes derwentensis]|uniref:Methyltransferase domain-containing protein n=1 Tax=Actinoplanes derwentensis TaxID=113562 RepID=A0A1H1ZMT4_9ACTN|nr:class I SAM-dependent methyltransferase [Actinoplanes derwentensis]GID82518.1 methyltransferase type 11 [Actinoplanes derwentensis]SDT34877.1 Methyltransferase domain-containing protein [Actinoplanes derwentensis]
MRLFGTVAGLYDSARPGYPAWIGESIVSFHGRAPSSVVEIGAGTGKGTAVLAGLGAPLTCIEPDPRMAAVLAGRFPAAVVHATTFEDWTPPDGGADVLACAMAWHWLDPATRNRLAFDALAPGGTLAIFGHRYGYADPDQGEAVRATLSRLNRTGSDRPLDWFHQDVLDHGCFTGVRKEVRRTPLPLDRTGYLNLMATFGPGLKQSPERQRQVQEALGRLVDDFGGNVVLDLRTTLVLGSR